MPSNRDPLIESHFEVVTLQSNTATVSVLKLLEDDRIVNFTGEARRDRGDKFDSELGLNLALSRLLAKLAEHYAKKAQKAVAALDREAEAKLKSELDANFEQFISTVKGQLAEMGIQVIDVDDLDEVDESFADGFGFDLPPGI